ncbi:unnamed protein product [Linum tenue]|uniref:Uncharacterized protein n=1 Tax=Linum tenue TaxID=586396 RepID=A0AAV0IF56_9ROSI|nr:unnamed protein product [Linum tenue]
MEQVSDNSVLKAGGTIDGIHASTNRFGH